MHPPCTAIVRRHLRKRLSRILRPCYGILIAACVIVFVLLQLPDVLEGGRNALTLLLLPAPLVFIALMEGILHCRAARNVRPDKVQSLLGYFVDCTDYLRQADRDTVKILSNTFLIRQDAGDENFAAAIQMTSPAWCAHAACFAFFPTAYFDAHRRAWAEDPEFDLVGDSSSLEQRIFFVFDKPLAAKVRSLCVEEFSSGDFRFPLSPECKAIFTSIKHMDEILLAAEGRDEARSSNVPVVEYAQPR